MVFSDQLIYTHNGEFKYMSSDPDNRRLHHIRKQLYEVFDSVYDLLPPNGSKGYALGQINVKIENNEYVAAVYYESTTGKSMRPFIHMHAIVVDKDSYIKNNLSLTCFLDRFIRYSAIEDKIHSLSKLEKVYIEECVPIQVDIQKLLELNTILDLKRTINHILSKAMGYTNTPLIINAKSEVEAIDLSVTILSLLPQFLRAEISTIIGSFNKIPRGVALAISTTPTIISNTYDSRNIKEFEIAKEVINALLTRDESKIREVQESYMRRYDEMKPLWGNETVKILIDEVYRKKSLEEKIKLLKNNIRQSLNNNDLDSAIKFYESLLSLISRSNGDDVLDVACLIAVHTDYLKIENLMNTYGKDKVLHVLNQLVRQGELKKSHLVSLYGKLAPLLLENEVRSRNYWPDLYKAIISLAVENTKDLSGLYRLYVHGHIDEESLARIFLSDLTSTVLDDLDPSSVSNSPIYGKLHEIRKLALDRGMRSGVNERLVRVLIKEYIKTLLQMSVSTRGLLRKSHALKVPPSKLLALVLGMPKDSIFNILVELADPDDLKSFYENVIDKAFREIIERRQK